MTVGKNVVLPFKPTSRSVAELKGMERALHEAIARNPLLHQRPASAVNVLIRGSRGEPEALREIAKGRHGRLIGHAFRHATTGIAYAVIVLVGWEPSPADARTTIAFYRRQVMEALRFAPAFARKDGEVYAEAPCGLAAVHRLAIMIRTLDPATAVELGQDACEADPDVRVLTAYWDPATLMDEGDDRPRS
jgi:hypothetical protein